MKMKEKKLGEKKKEILFYTLSVLIPIGLMLLLYAKLKLYPFGEKCLLYYDLQDQYIPFLSFFKENITNIAKWIYQFSNTIGGNAISLNAYYTTSIFNVILPFFNQEHLIEMIYVLTLLKLGASGLTIAIYLKQTFKQVSNIKLFMFVLAYTFMSYNIVYQLSIMWLDALVFLPLILLGIDKLVKTKKGYLYIISFAILIISNYYTAFMVGVFSILYFIYRYLLNLEKITWKSIWEQRKKIWIFIGSSLLACGISAILFLPNLIALQGGKMTFSLETLKLTENFKTLDLLPRFFTGSEQFSDTCTYPGQPMLFCGVMTFLFLILYFLNAKITKKEKLFSAGMLGIWIGIMQINTFNVLMHAGNVPTCFPFRYSFLISTFIILLAARSLEKLKEGIGTKQLNIAGIILIGSLIFIDKFYEIRLLSIGWDILILGIVIIALYAIIKNCKKEKMISLLLVMVMGIDMVLNSYLYLKQINFANKDEYMNYVDENQTIVNTIQENENEKFYRIEKTDKLTKNDSMLLNYNGIGQFSSTEKERSVLFARKMGYQQVWYTTRYNKQNVPISSDCLLNIKYVISKEKPNNYYEETNLGTQTDAKVYRNPYTMPIAFMVNEEISNLTGELEKSDIFEWQNALYHAMVPEIDKKIWIKANDIQIKTENVSEVTLDEQIEYQKQKEEEYTAITYTIPIKESRPLYAYFNSSFRENAEIIVNGDSRGEYFNEENNNTFYVGDYKKGETIKVTIVLKENKLETNINPFYYFDIDAFKECYQILQQEKINLEESNEATYFKGSIKNTNDENKMLIMIPYSKEWNVLVDGKKVETEEAFDVMTLVDIPEGQHIVEFKYQARGIREGTIITIVSLLILIGIPTLSNQKKKRKKNKGG